MPASKYLSLDIKIFSGYKSGVTEKWNYFLFKFLIACVYIYAAIAKISPGWLEHHFLPIRLEYSAQWFEGQFSENFFSNFLRYSQLAESLSYAGILFDFLIVPLLLFKPTRRIAFVLGIIFHLFNSITLHIGIFPYFALAMCVFFFDSTVINRLFFPFKQVDKMEERYTFKWRKNLVMSLVLLFCLIQIYLPLRHHLIPGDVLWTEEGHRMAWRMMLRSKSGSGTFEIELPSGERRTVATLEYLSPNQHRRIYTKPDMIWQFAQTIKADYREKGMDIKVYYKNSKVRINDGPFHPFIDDSVDLAHTSWRYFSHQKWILPEPADYYLLSN